MSQLHTPYVQSLVLLALKAIMKTAVAESQKAHEENNCDFNDLNIIPELLERTYRIDNPRNERAPPNDTFSPSTAFQKWNWFFAVPSTCLSRETDSDSVGRMVPWLLPLTRDVSVSFVTSQADLQSWNLMKWILNCVGEAFGLIMNLQHLFPPARKCPINQANLATQVKKAAHRWRWNDLC